MKTTALVVALLLGIAGLVSGVILIRRRQRSVYPCVFCIGGIATLMSSTLILMGAIATTTH